MHNGDDSSNRTQIVEFDPAAPGRASIRLQPTTADAIMCRRG